MEGTFNWNVGLCCVFISSVFYDLEDRIVEFWEIYMSQAVQNIEKLNPDLLVDNPAQIVNWDFVSDFVSVVGRIFRSAKHCRYQYEYVVLPREDGKVMYSIKQKKTPKSIYKVGSYLRSVCCNKFRNVELL